MTSRKILTAVTLVVPPEREAELVSGYREMVVDGARPDGLLRSELLRGQDGRWVVQTLWRDREAILAARQRGVLPAALALAERVGAEHSHDILTVEQEAPCPGAGSGTAEQPRQAGP
jgi:heme-degrading monooxygenase HmoA